MMQMHVEPPPIVLIKSEQDDNSDKDFVKLKLHRDSTSFSSDMYKFQVDLFDNGKPEEFFFCEKLQYYYYGVRDTGDGRKK